MRIKELTISAFSIAILMVTFTACEKQEVLIHENLVVPGNKAKDYSGISTVLVENYVQKIYIDLIGQKPTQAQFEDAMLHLESNDLSEASRIDVINDVIAEQAYHDRFFQIVSSLMLNGMSFEEVDNTRLEYIFIRDLIYATGDTLTGQIIDFEVKKLEALVAAPTDYQNGDINVDEYFARMCYNLIYDEINMGSENFAISCFENFFKRYPTVEELERSVKMIDANVTTLLLQEGLNKEDFIEIVTSNVEFYQGRILDAYLTLLLRTPDSGELTAATNKFLQSNDFEEVQIDIVKTDEYAGFE